jgi:sialate O-acetylesterase
MIRRLLFALLAWVGIADGLNMVPNARADVKVPAIFGDHMVLQRDAKLKFWGWAEPGENVCLLYTSPSPRDV